MEEQDTPATQASDAPNAAPANDVESHQQIAGPHDWMPEKFRTQSEGGALDIEASARKLAESYTGLARRMGDVGLPPADADGYEWAAPEGFDTDGERLKAFQERALALGLSKKQFGSLMDIYSADVAPNLYARIHEHQAQATREQLKRELGGEEAFERTRYQALEAFKAFADPQDMAGVERLGNDPAFIRVMAKIQREAISEDRSVLAGDASSDSGVKDLMSDPKSAYWDPANPGHEAAKVMVKRYYEAQARARKG